MSENDVTVEKIEKELFKIVDGTSSGGPDTAARVEAAKILLARLDYRNLPPLSVS